MLVVKLGKVYTTQSRSHSRYVLYKLKRHHFYLDIHIELFLKLEQPNICKDKKIMFGQSSFKKFNMEIKVKRVSFQIIQNILTVKFSLVQTHYHRSQVVEIHFENSRNFIKNAFYFKTNLHKSSNYKRGSNIKKNMILHLLQYLDISLGQLPLYEAKLP